MQFLYEIFPVFLFFLAFKFYGIYVATTVGIITTFIQVILYRLWVGRWDNKQVITLAVFLLFGGMTLYFHDPIFVKWKPTIIYWIFAIALLVTQWFTHKPLIQRLFEKALDDKASIPRVIWKWINLSWAIFFILLGMINLYIAYHYSNEFWVNFKFYGVSSALFIFSIIQAIFLSLFIKEK